MVLVLQRGNSLCAEAIRSYDATTALELLDAPRLFEAQVFSGCHTLLGHMDQFDVHGQRCRQVAQTLLGTSIFLMCLDKARDSVGVETWEALGAPPVGPQARSE